MNITRYNRGSGKYPIGSQASINASKSNSTTTTTSGGVDCELWGNHCDGTEDLEDTIFVNGSVYAMPSKYGESGDDENDDNIDEDNPDFEPEERQFEPEEDDHGGNIYAENLIKSFGDIKAEKNIEGKDLKANAHIYLPYPTATDTPQDLAPLIKDHADKLDDHEGRINTNTTNISNLTTRMGNAETAISNCETHCSSNETRISNNETEIANIWEQLNSQDTSSPVILFSGLIHSNNQDTSSTNYQPWNVRPNMYAQHIGVQNIEMSYYEINGEQKPSLVIKVNPKDGWTVRPLSVQSSVVLSMHWNPTVDFGGNRRSQGYWTTGGVFVDGKIYIQVWRTGDENNDTVTNDCIAWQTQEMNLTIYGTAYKNP